MSVKGENQSVAGNEELQDLRRRRFLNKHWQEEGFMGKTRAVDVGAAHCI